MDRTYGRVQSNSSMLEAALEPFLKASPNLQSFRLNDRFCDPIRPKLFRLLAFNNNLIDLSLRSEQEYLQPDAIPSSMDDNHQLFPKMRSLSPKLKGESFKLLVRIINSTYSTSMLESSLKGKRLAGLPNLQSLDVWVSGLSEHVKSLPCPELSITQALVLEMGRLRCG